MKKITGKRTKTEDDYRELAKIEWMASLYLKDKKVCIPGMVLDGEPVVCSCAVKVWRQMEKETPVVSVSEDQHERVVDTVVEVSCLAR